MESYIQGMAGHLSKLLICLLVVMTTQVHGSELVVNITFLDSAVSKGAVCLDGSPPAYYYAKGSGDGVNNWFVFLEGGGWCGTDADCVQRKTQHVGSSKYKSTNSSFGEIFSEYKTINPDFYDWNKVLVTYCDGSSFMGDINAVDPKTNLTIRGKRIFDAVMDDLLAKGMENATNAILGGGSAGGLSAILHCDGFRALIPNTSRVKCISDSGFFLYAKKIHGADLRAEYFTNVTTYHGITKSLPASCTSKMNASLCIFPENIAKDIKTPIFYLESAFDQYQVAEHYVSDDPTWRNCTYGGLEHCTAAQLQTMREFGAVFRETLQEIGKCSPSTGIFVHSCYRHGHLYEPRGWDKSYVLGNKTIAQAIGDWYYDRSSVQEIDTEHEFPLTRNCTLIA